MGSWHPATDGNAHTALLAAAKMKHFASKKTLLVLSTALVALTAAYKIEEPAARGETLEYDDAPDSSSMGLRYRNDDYAAFSEIIDMLLFDEDPDPYADEGARGYYSARQGLLGMPMPDYVRKQDTFTGRLYGGFKEQCFSLSCQLGLSGFFRSIRDLVGMKK